LTAGTPSAGPRLPVLLIAGPTASGKSALALALAEAFDGTVINADAMQVYRELRILTARPTPAEEARVLHRLYGIRPVDDPCSAGHWLTLAVAAIDEAWAASRLPIVVGGSGLYLRALTHGLSPVPPIPPHVRAHSRALHAALGGKAFRQELARLDPAAAERISAGDRQRLIRAHEVLLTTGIPLTRWQRMGPARPAIAARFATILLMPPRQRLAAAISARFEAMLGCGAVAEAASLTHLAQDLPASKAVGLRPLQAYLRGEMTLDAACAIATRDSRRYAKRQITWFRHQFQADLVLYAQFSESHAAQIFAFIRRFLLTGAD
jgi:tRNA dimethylallyltransferase